MIFKCNKNKLQDAISIVQKAITGKSSMQILDGIYIEANNEVVTFIGSDKDISIETRLTAEIVETGKLVIDSKIFGEIIKKLPNSDVTIKIIDNNLIQITCEKTNFSIIHMNANEFPSFPQINESNIIVLSQSLLKNMIKGTSFATAQDETRPILQGVLFEIKDKNLNLVALDGYRLAIKSNFIDSTNNISTVIPGKVLNEVAKILDDSSDSIVNITCTDNHILFNLGDTKIISRLLEGEFIKYDSLLPQEHKLLIEIKKQDFQNGIERASLMVKEGNSNLIKLDVQTDNIIITSNSQMGKVREEVSIDLQGEELEIAFNSKYLLDVLKNMDDNQIIMELTSNISPCIIRNKNNNNCKYLVLPVRLVK